MVKKKENDPVLLVPAAGHVIVDEAAFTDAVMKALPLAEEGKLIIFGVVLTKAHTGCGYIETGGSL